MESYYPIMLSLAGKKVVIVGGGKVAERKVLGLLGSMANILVVAPDVSPEINRLAKTGKVTWLVKRFSKEDLEGAFMIFAATNDKGLNQAIKNAAVFCPLVTIADDPKGSNFQVPAKVQRGRLTIAVSTGGASPILARKIRAQLEQAFDEKYQDYLEFLFAARQQIIQKVKDSKIKSELLNLITSQEFIHSENRQADFQDLLRKTIRQVPSE